MFTAKVNGVHVAGDTPEALAWASGHVRRNEPFLGANVLDRRGETRMIAEIWREPPVHVRFDGDTALVPWSECSWK